MIDSRDKRASAIGDFSFLEVLPLADGAIDQGDRQQTAWTYRGIAAETPLTVPGIEYSTDDELIQFTTDPQRLHFTVTLSQ